MSRSFSMRLVLLACLPMVAACGIKGDPRPPEAPAAERAPPAPPAAPQLDPQGVKPGPSSPVMGPGAGAADGGF